MQMNEGVYIQNDSTNPFAEQADVWEDILRNWIRMIVRYCNHLDGEEAPYYFNERANIGLLAAAAWQSGCVALEEFQADKKCSDNGRSNGRADLWIGAGKESYWLEAKLGWPNLRHNVNGFSQKTGLAWSDAQRLDVYKHEHRIALTFLVPYYSVQNAEAHEEYLGHFIKNINNHDNIMCDAKAWVFPSATRSLKGVDGKHYPGVAILLSKVK